MSSGNEIADASRGTRLVAWANKVLQPGSHRPAVAGRYGGDDADARRAAWVEDGPQLGPYRFTPVHGRF